MSDETIKEEIENLYKVLTNSTRSRMERLTIINKLFDDEKDVISAQIKELQEKCSHSSINRGIFFDQCDFCGLMSE